MSILPTIGFALPAGLAIWTPGPPEIIIILVVVLLLFGGKKLPELARGLARGLRTFKDEMKGIKTDIDESETPTNDTQQGEQGDKGDKGDKGEQDQS